MQNKLLHMQDARNLMRTQHSAVLSTNSLSMKGYPFGSVVPFLMTESGDVVIYASDIAQHSRNINANSHVSLCVFDGAQNDSQSSARVTLLAHAFADQVESELKAMYFHLFPQAKSYEAAHDFRFYWLKTERVRYIGGFGEIYWFSQGEWTDTLVSLNKHQESIIQHMHDDHSDALADIISHFTSLKAQRHEVTMLSCFAQGFHYSCQHKIGFISFLSEVSEQYDVRKAMVELSMAAKKRIISP